MKLCKYTIHGFYREMLRKLVDTVDGSVIPRPTTERMYKTLGCINYQETWLWIFVLNENAKVPSCAIGPNHEEGGPRFEVEVTWVNSCFSDDVRPKWLGDIF